MKPIFSLIATALAALFLVSQIPVEAQGPIEKPIRFSFQGQNGPALIPSVSTDVCTAGRPACSTTRSVWIMSITLSEESGSGDTCWIVDKQATPRSIYGTAAHPQPVIGTQIQIYPDRLAVGGVTWGCTNGTVTGQISYEY